MDKCEHKIVTVTDGPFAYNECERCGKISNVIYIQTTRGNNEYDETLLGI